MEGILSFLGGIDIASLGRAVFFMGIIIVLAVSILQWKWARTCDNYIQVLVALQGGSGKYTLAPKEGGQVSIRNPETDEVRVWPINELATIDVTYPGVGFVPGFLQKKIRQAILSEGDWEPLLNRSPHRLKVASPDVVKFLLKIAEENTELKPIIDEYLKGISTGPTREMIASPAMIGNLMQSSALKALASVSNELMDVLKSLNTRISRFTGMNPTVIYIGMGLMIIGLGFLIFQQMQGASDIDAIKSYLGV